MKVQPEERWASEWWDGLAKIERGEFERTARDLVGRLAILRTLVTEAGAGRYRISGDSMSHWHTLVVGLGTVRENIVRRLAV